MHLGPDPWQGTRQAAHQPAQVLVSQPRLDQRRRRYGYVPLEAAAAGPSCAACLWVLAGISVSHTAGQHAAAPDRHRTFQICFLSAERVDQARPERTIL